MESVTVVLVSMAEEASSPSGEPYEPQPLRTSAAVTSGTLSFTRQVSFIFVFASERLDFHPSSAQTNGQAECQEYDVSLSIVVHNTDKVKY